MRAQGAGRDTPSYAGLYLILCLILCLISQNDKTRKPYSRVAVAYIMGSSLRHARVAGAYLMFQRSRTGHGAAIAAFVVSTPAFVIASFATAAVGAAHDGAVQAVAQHQRKVPLEHLCTIVSCF